MGASAAPTGIVAFSADDTRVYLGTRRADGLHEPGASGAMDVFADETMILRSFNGIADDARQMAQFGDLLDGPEVAGWAGATLRVTASRAPDVVLRRRLRQL